MIDPHGGTLVQRVLEGSALDEARERAGSLPRLTVNHDTARDAQNIARGVFSPLEGFVGKEDLDSILAGYRLSNGVPWTIPILLDVPSQDAVPEGEDVCLVQEGSDAPLAYLELKSIGLPADRTAELSAALCGLISTELSVASDRIYIEFADAQRHLWGWDSATF